MCIGISLQHQRDVTRASSPRRQTRKQRERVRKTTLTQTLREAYDTMCKRERATARRPCFGGWIVFWRMEFVYIRDREERREEA